MKLHAFLLVIATVIAVTAVAAQLPTDYRQGTHFLNHPHRFPAYFQPEEPIAVEQNFRVQSVGVESLKAGQIVEVQYKSPNSGRALVTFRAANGDQILNAAARIQWQSSTNEYVLSSYTNGQRLPLVFVEGFPFTCPPLQTTITVQIAVTDEDFVVTVNGITLVNYPFRGSLTPDKVETIQFRLEDGTASIKGVLDKITVSF